MNPTLRGVIVRMGIVLVKLALVGTGAVGARAAEEERPPIFAAKIVPEQTSAEKKAPLLSAMAKRRIAEKVLNDLEGAPKADVQAAGRSAEALGADGDVVVLERYVVRAQATPEMLDPKNRWLETIRTGRLYQNPGPRTTKTVDLLGSSVWNSTVGDTGDAKLTLKFTIWW